MTVQFGVEAKVQICFREVPSSNHGDDTSYPEVLFVNVLTHSLPE